MPTEPGGPSRRGQRPALSIALLAACVWLAVPADAQAGEPPVHTVAIRGVAFDPAAVTVKAGDVVVWVNHDPFPHTVTVHGVFDSGSIAAGRSWKYVPRKAGDYAYTCALHPNMKGTLRVE